MARRPQEHKRQRRRVQVRFGEGEPQYLGFSRNLSPGGLMIGSMRVFEPGTILDLELTFPDRTFFLRGQVVWAREGPHQWLISGRVGMGIRFVDVPPPDMVERIGYGVRTA